MQLYNGLPGLQSLKMVNNQSYACELIFNRMFRGNFKSEEVLASKVVK